MKLFYIFWLNGLVFGGKSVVDKTTVEEGETFTWTCDHLHVNGTVPKCPFRFLHMGYCPPGRKMDIILTLDDTPSRIPFRVPSGRDWTKDCNRSNDELAIETFGCKITVKNAKVADSGRYGCLFCVMCTEDGTILEGCSVVTVNKVTTTSMSTVLTSDTTFLDWRLTETSTDLPKGTSKKSDASSSFGKKTNIGLCLVMVIATHLTLDCVL